MNFYMLEVNPAYEDQTGASKEPVEKERFAVLFSNITERKKQKEK